MTNSKTASKKDTQPFAGYGDGKRALLSAAVRVIGDEGFAAFTMRRIAQEAGVAHGLIKYYFGTREELISQALSYATESSLTDTHMHVDIESIDEFGTYLIDATMVDISRQVFQYEMAIKSIRQTELKTVVAKINADYRAAISKHLKQIGLGSDPALANLVFAFYDGIVMELITIGDVALAKQSISKLRTLLSAYKASK